MAVTANYAAVTILVFARAPIPGAVKTRLATEIGDQRAAALHRKLMHRAAETAVNADVGPVTLCCTPDSNHESFRALQAEFGLALDTQRGADLGERMYRSMNTAIRGHSAAIVIGSDCPAIDSRYLQAAARLLSSGQAPVVIGPATDGGYVLLGASQIDESMFTDIPWGSEEVLALTRQRLAKLGWRWRELTALSDIDRPEDLRRLEPGWLD